MNKSATRTSIEGAAFSRTSLFLLRALGTLTFALLLALSARWRVPLPWSPVPVTGQTLVALLFPALLGPLAGACGVVLYLLLGLAGLPFFALGGGGIYLLGPTGGYLWGFLFAALIVGALVRRSSRLPAVVAAMILGEAVILSLGAMQLKAVTGSGWGWVFAAGVAPFLPGDLIKLVLAAGLYRVLGPRAARLGFPVGI